MHSGAAGVGLLGYALAAIITLWLSGRIRNLGRTGRLLRRVYLVATLALLSVFALVVSQLFFDVLDFRGGIPWGFVVATFIAGALWLPVQAFFAAGFLGLLIKGSTPIV